MINENKLSIEKIWNKPLTIAIILLAVSILPSFFIGENLVATLTKIAIMALFAVSLNLQLGYTDLPALGQVAYFGFGAYALTLLTTRAGFSLLPSMIITLVGAVILSIFIGYICLRSGTLFGFIFLNNGISLLIYSFVNKWMWIGADGGILGTPRPSFAQGTLSFHIFAVIVIAICIGLLYLIRLSPLTSMLLGCRENDQRLLFLGVNIKNVKWYCHIISASFTVVAGMLFAMRNMAAYPTYLLNLLSTEMVIACIIGGKNNFMGPVLGAAIVTGINTGVSNHTIYYQLILGIIIFVAVYFMPGGIIPGIESKKDTIMKFPNLIKSRVLGLIKN